MYPSISKRALPRKKTNTVFPNISTPYTENLQSAKSKSWKEYLKKNSVYISIYTSIISITTVAATTIFPPAAAIPLIVSSIITAAIGFSGITYGSSGVLSNIWNSFCLACEVSQSTALRIYNKSAETLSAVYAKISSDASRTRDYISKISNYCYIYLERYFYNLIMLLIIAVIIAFFFLKYVLNIQCQCKVLI